ncbi:unnamed protein product [Prorocentrum cordatum]|uniref:1,3-beta-glucan synthase n=1 Tax=Prorocentrum cordatum TaxID=2364126 RepID=A0ABN9S4M8_9DINO|nr:unnamed protein product [Polarella glacialis]
MLGLPQRSEADSAPHPEDAVSTTPPPSSLGAVSAASVAVPNALAATGAGAESIDVEAGAGVEAEANAPASTRLPPRGLSRLSRHKSAADSASPLPEEEPDEEESSLPRPEKCCWACRNHCGKGKGGSCYWCFVIVFFMFCFEFPVFLVWMVNSPMPNQYWNEMYGKFPVLEDHTFIVNDNISRFTLNVSPIPTAFSQCNHSCGGGADSSADVSFSVDMKLSAPDFEHTAYPVLLASNDFQNWWVAADKRDSMTVPFFPSHSAENAAIYQHTTGECTRVPGMGSSGAETTTLPPTELFASTPTYVMVCVAWSSDKIAWLEDEANHEIMGAERENIGLHCDAVGGVCGWSCGSSSSDTDLPGCSAGVLNVNNEESTVAGRSVPNASFGGSIDVRACLSDPGSTECITSTVPFSGWPCTQCRYTTRGENERKEYIDYDSLPRMQVNLRGAAQADGSLVGADSVPRAYVFTTGVDASGEGPAGMMSGKWKRLYNPAAYNALESPAPIPLALYEEEEVEDDETTLAPAYQDASWNAMQFRDMNKISLKPDKCFAARGPLYIVACAVNSSMYADKFELELAQTVAPPPFTDRCLAVAGRCAHACMDQGSPLEHCNADGSIDFAVLTSNFETPANDGYAVNFFVLVLLIGFAVRLVTYFPGLFIPYKHPKYYDPAMTGKLKYIAVCAPSGGETKACVLRNVVGAFSGMPRKCQCPFYVVFADEGHRHPQKVMFRALVTVLQHVPDISLNQSKANRSPRNGSIGGFKEDNLKTFTKLWVEQTRLFRLEQCNTAKTADKINKLRQALKEDEEPTAEIRKLEKQLDDLAGVNALKTLQARAGWPKSGDGSEGGELIRDLEEALQQVRKELACGEKTFDGAGTCDKRVPVHLDDVEAYSWTPPASSSNPTPAPLYTLHYLARAKPDEDDRILKVQHVARGTWYYKVPQLEEARGQKSWLEWRRHAQEFTDADFDTKKYLVPLRTSRGKAGGLNFVENYLFDYSMKLAPSAMEALEPERYKHSLFSIADARHQFQPDFMHETIPFFFRKLKDQEQEQEVDTSVAFTQCPQYYPEMPDDVDFLDTNNSNFFRMNCMLRNCSGGVSSCGTGGTWLIRDRRAGIRGTDSIWDMESVEMKRQGFTQCIEYTFFHESCKVEDTASSLDRVVKGKHSQYINRRLAYGMAKDPVDYLAAVQRWAEGGVVLSLQTFLGCEEGIHMIWMTFILFLSFIGSLVNLVYGYGYTGLLEEFSLRVFGGDLFYVAMVDVATQLSDWCVAYGAVEEVYKYIFIDMFLNVQGWLIAMLLFFVVLTIITMASHYLHHCACCGRKRKLRRTRFPTSLAQWARLLITMDNLTYFLWFWTAFFWVGFNYYAVYFKRYYHFEASGMVLFSWMMQVLSWSMVISATGRYRMDQSMAANEVFFLSLTNIWRTTQMFYITAPLTAYSIVMGISDFLKNRMLGVDISYWVGGDRGAVSKAMTQWWTLLLVLAMIVTHILFWFTELLIHADVVGIFIVTFIGLDVMHPCAFLWLGVEAESLPKPAVGPMPVWVRFLRRTLQLLLCPAFWRNCMRKVVFHPRTALIVQWIGPLQNVLMPILTIWMPELGINNALLLLASVK